MKRVASLVCWLIALVSADSGCTRDYMSIYNGTDLIREHKIARNMLCNYDNLIPAKTYFITAIQVVKSFKYSIENQKLSLDVLTVMNWYDSRLAWRWLGVDRGVIEKVHVDGRRLWMPRIKLVESVKDYDDGSYIDCQVSPSGNVVCFRNLIYEARCVPELSDWPHVTQTCSMSFETENRTADTYYRLRYFDAGFMVFGKNSDRGDEWDIVDFKDGIIQTTDGRVQVLTKLTMVKHAQVSIAMVIYPSIILSVLTLSTLLLNVRGNERLFVTCFSLFCHLYLLTVMSSYISKHSASVPKIVVFLRGSVIVSAVCLVLTLRLRSLCEKNTPPPHWIAAMTEYVFNSYSRLVLLRNTYVKGSVWTDFSNLVSFVWTICVILIYIVLYCMFLPTPQTLHKNVKVSDIPLALKRAFI